MEHNDKGSFEMHPPPPEAPPKVKPLHISSLVLSIIGLIFAFTSPRIIAIVCIPIALVLSVQYRRSYRTMAALVISVIAIVVFVIAWIALVTATM